MQIKIFIIGVLIVCSYLIGEYIYKAYTKRHKEVNDLIRILEIMRMDLSFGLYTLEEIFKRLGDKEEFCTSNFFKRLENELHNNSYKVLDEILNDSIQILIKETYLQDKEINELKKLIFTLGKSDIESQSRMIDLSIENLKKITGETKEDIKQKGIVYRKLATIVGIIIGIILI
ncbi:MULTISPECIES: stage III sporulation protein AB [Romboutsia]|uniref:Stage III sporulation protein AB n=1 Tax=Romboutsia ilealis TaxID=1115758 RepID=A0A1V1I2T9_9FIRM|nr:MULTISPECIES: stage III sporulation protein AB [Romboutsia]MCI9062267.1 stage III sporulation protein AB [Romboutsia sp.]CED94528.1 Stage III sporulation protein AB [Romboutsia ilealis]